MGRLSLCAHRYGLDNLTAVIDRNRLQSYAHDDKVLDMGDMNEKLLAMGWDSVSVDGHDPCRALGGVRARCTWQADGDCRQHR